MDSFHRGHVARSSWGGTTVETASCTCGYRGPERYESGDALVDLNQHVMGALRPSGAGAVGLAEQFQRGLSVLAVDTSPLITRVEA